MSIPVLPTRFEIITEIVEHATSEHEIVATAREFPFSSRTCVACGQRYFGHNHHCNPATIERIEREYEALEDSPEARPTYDERLADGFEYLRLITD